MKKLIASILILSTISLTSCGAEKTYVIQSNNISSSTTEKVQEIKIKETPFEDYKDDIKAEYVIFDKPYKIVGQASGSGYNDIQFISKNKIRWVAIRNLTPDDDLKTLINGYVVFDSNKMIIRVINEENLNEYNKQ